MSDHRFNTGIITAGLFALLIPAIGLAQSVAVYTVHFDASWSEETHPDGFPSSPHFSGLIGGTHNDGVSFDYIPSPVGDYDSNVTDIVVNPKGIFQGNTGTAPSCTIIFRVRID